MAHPEEIVDIVDPQNAVMLQVSKFEAHEKGLLHRVVIGEVKDSEGRWVLVRQSSDRQDAGQYVSAIGGHVAAGETEEDALRREAFEEGGLKQFRSALIGKKIFNRTVLGRQENHYFILYEIYTDEALVLNEESVDCVLFTDGALKDALKKHPEQFGGGFHFVMQNFCPDFLQ